MTRIFNNLQGSQKDWLAAFGAEKMPNGMACDHIHCNVAGTYRIYDVYNKYVDRYLAKGLPYPGGFITKITTTGDAAIDVGDITVIF